MPTLMVPLERLLLQGEASELTAEAGLDESRRHGIGESVAGTIINEEQPWHSSAIQLIAKGFSQKETAEIVGVKQPTVAYLLRQEWGIAKLKECLEKEMEPISNLFKGAALSAYFTIHEICNNPKAAPRDRISAAKEILDRHLGKSTQFMEIKTENHNTNVVEETKALEQEAIALREKLHLIK